MDTEEDSHYSQASSTSFVICELCSKKFGCVKLLNRHKKRIHKIEPVDTRKSWIICPICEVKEELKSHEVLLKHLRETHEINVELQTLQFPSIQEYELWKNDTKNKNIECNYAVCKTRKARDFKEVVYICNRSDNRGYQPNYNIRTEKAGGTIRIKGMCPSKLICKFHDNGFVSIRFWNTHAGHVKELRTSHLPKSEKDFQYRIITKAHKNAEAQMINVKVFEGSQRGKFLVKSSTKNQYYNVENSGVCENNCRTLYCGVCKICIHIYKCDCPEYAAKNTMCKHVHLIRMYVERTGNSSLLDDTALELAEDSVIKSGNRKEIAHFIEEKYMQQQKKKLDDQDARKLRLINHTRWLEVLDGEVFDKFMDDIQEAVNKADQANLKLPKKRKMKKQEYFPLKKTFKIRKHQHEL